MEHIVSDQDPRPRPDRTPASWECPFFNTTAAVCQAAITHRTPPRKVRTAVCGGGDYEGCTTFLVRLLNRPPARVR
jgi:hypothetical protein